jgi:hypothetical protein
MNCWPLHISNEILHGAALWQYRLFFSLAAPNLGMQLELIDKNRSRWQSKTPSRPYKFTKAVQMPA